MSGFQDIAITDSNRSAIETIQRWQAWKANALCLTGPLRCGLGVAARLWVKEFGGVFLDAAEFDAQSPKDIEALASGKCAIDLADKVMNEANLLMVLNLAIHDDSRVLLTARSSSAVWPCKNLDLKSRLDALPVAEIYPPDEDMITARLLASCKARFIRLAPAAVKFLAVRLPRSYEAIEDYVQRLDQAISDTGLPANLKLASLVLEEGSSSRELFGEDLI